MTDQSDGLVAAEAKFLQALGQCGLCSSMCGKQLEAGADAGLTEDQIRTVLARNIARYKDTPSDDGPALGGGNATG